MLLRWARRCSASALVTPPHCVCRSMQIVCCFTPLTNRASNRQVSPPLQGRSPNAMSLNALRLADLTTEARHATAFALQAAKNAVPGDTVAELLSQQYCTYSAGAAAPPAPKPRSSGGVAEALSGGAAPTPAVAAYTARELRPDGCNLIMRGKRHYQGKPLHGFGEKPTGTPRGRAVAQHQPVTGIPPPLPGLPPPRSAEPAPAAEPQDRVARHARSTVGDLIFGQPTLQSMPPAPRHLVRQPPPATPPRPARRAGGPGGGPQYHSSRWKDVEPRVMAWRQAGARPCSAPSAGTSRSRGAADRLMPHQQPGRLGQLRQWQGRASAW